MRTIEREIVGGFIFSKDDKLLVGQSIKGGVYANKWIIPGGGIEEGETKLEALKREMLEETGINIDEATVEHLDHQMSGESEKTLRDTGEHVHVKMQFHNFVIRLSDIAAAVGVKAEDDFINVKWLSVSEFATTEFSPPTITTLRLLGYLK
jgi:8-oxo-dGTP pyrophosphatase MutT (NUDIX family)